MEWLRFRVSQRSVAAAAIAADRNSAVKLHVSRWAEAIVSLYRELTKLFGGICDRIQMEAPADNFAECLFAYMESMDAWSEGVEDLAAELHALRASYVGLVDELLDAQRINRCEALSYRVACLLFCSFAFLFCV